MERQDSAVGERASECARCGAETGASVPAYAAALVVMLEQALLAAKHLLDALDGAAIHRAEAVQLVRRS